MDNNGLVLLGVGLIALLQIFIFVRLSRGRNANQDSEGIKLLQQHIFELNKQVDGKLSETNKTINDQLFQSQKLMQQQFSIAQRSAQDISKLSTDIIRSVTEKLTKLEETNTQIKTFATQLQSLENVLKNPKQRGILGEYFLETLLKNVLPPKSYQMQYKFKNGEIVDSVIFVKEKIIPIDSKFSLENYNKILKSDNEAEREQLQKQFKQDLKNRIDETSKYIRPEEGTMEFAFMFIPAEGIYYDLLINQIGVVKTNTVDLIEYAFKEKGVIIVSPTSFLAYLQTVLQGLRALHIEEQAVQIRNNVGKLQKHLAAFEEYQQKLGRGLTSAVGAFNDAQKEFVKVDKDLIAITGHEESIITDQLTLDKPHTDS